MIRCFSSLGCPELSLDETLALAERFAIPRVELRALGGTLDLAAYLRGTYGSPAQLSERPRHSPVRVVALDASLHLIGGTAGERHELSLLAPWADAAGARWLRAFDGGKSADAAELAEAGETLRWWRSLRAERGWQADLMIETHDSLLNAAAIRRFMAAAPGVAVLWDAHHTWRKGGEDPVKTWKEIRDAVVHVHVKDSVAVPSARHPFTYVLPGDGGFPVRPVLAALHADGFNGCVSLEWEKQWHPYLPPLDEALATAASREWW